MKETSKKEIIKRFYDLVMLKGNEDVAKEIMKKDYKQHNPQAKDGRDGLLEHVDELDRDYPERKIELIHLFEDGDYVITHIHFILSSTLEAVGMDIFRFQDSLIAEHWDVIQVITNESKNGNKMY